MGTWLCTVRTFLCSWEGEGEHWVHLLGPFSSVYFVPVHKDLWRFHLEAQGSHFPSPVAGFPKLLRAAPPASGEGARSWHLAVLLRALKPCVLLPHPQPTLDNMSAVVCARFFFQKYHLRLSFQKLETPDSFSLMPIFWEVTHCQC